MKMSFAAKGFWLAAAFFTVAFIPGCATAPPVDWNSRVGQYTYAQAVHELGPPNRQSRLSSGAIVSKWFLQPSATTAMSNNGLNNGFGLGQSINVGLADRYLQLTFDTNGMLTAWSKNY